MPRNDWAVAIVAGVIGASLAAGVGMACGCGSYIIAFAATVIAILVFSMLLKLETAIRKRYGREEE